jgi:hypothetical protein
MLLLIEELASDTDAGVGLDPLAASFKALDV